MRAISVCYHLCMSVSVSVCECVMLTMEGPEEGDYVVMLHAGQQCHLMVG